MTRECYPGLDEAPRRLIESGQSSLYITVALDGVRVDVKVRLGQCRERRHCCKIALECIRVLWACYAEGFLLVEPAASFVTGHQPQLS